MTNATQPEAKPYAIVVGIDFTELSDLALERACDLAAARRQTHVHVVHVQSAPTSSSYAPSPGAQSGAPTSDLTQASTRLHEHVEQVVRRWCERQSRQPSFERLTTHVRSDAPTEAIAQLAADIEAQLIIVGTHSRRGAQRFLLGSVAEGTVRLAPCDVLVVRPPDATIPKIEPPCPRCLETRRATNGTEFWCEQHRQRHERWHTYHYSPEARGHQSGFLIHVK